MTARDASQEQAPFYPREIRRYVSPIGPIVALVVLGLLFTLSVVLWLYSPNGWWVGAILSCILGVILARALIVLVNCMLFRTPYLLIDSSGFTYASPYMLWRKRHIPWADVSTLTLSTIHTGAYRTYYASGSLSSRLLVQARHPERYLPAWRRRFSVWWNPPRRGATISISTGSSLKQRAEFVKSLQIPFEPEIEKYGIKVSWSTRE